MVVVVIANGKTRGRRRSLRSGDSFSDCLGVVFVVAILDVVVLVGVVHQRAVRVANGRGNGEVAAAVARAAHVAVSAVVVATVGLRAEAAEHGLLSAAAVALVALPVRALQILAPQCAVPVARARPVAVPVAEAVARVGVRRDGRAQRLRRVRARAGQRARGRGQHGAAAHHAPAHARKHTGPRAGCGQGARSLLRRRRRRRLGLGLGLRVGL